MPIGMVLQVALLAVASSFIARKLGDRIPARFEPLLPVFFAMIIYWGFVAEPGTGLGAIAELGAVSGLLAGGMVYILRGVGGRLR
jgi:hypothetical protein